MNAFAMALRYNAFAGLSLPPWWNGIHGGLKIPAHYERAGSTPAGGTT